MCKVESNRLWFRKVVFGFVTGRSAQSLVILDLETLGGIGLSPLFVFVLAVEVLDRRSLDCLHDGCSHVGQEAWNRNEFMPELVEEVDKQASNVRTIVVLVRHNHDASVSQLCGGFVFLPGLKT